MIRSIIFNFFYYVGTLVIGILIVPSLLMPERSYLPFIRRYFALMHGFEKYLLGLDYAVEGREYLPANGPYIVAAKHQSAYETIKLPLLFDRPVVILKRELFQIPFWGWYAKKAGNIGIDRSKPREALSQMVQGVKDAIAQNRTVVIFPQGTRVGIHETSAQKPYKRGIAEIYETLGVPVVPMAVNSGLFWPRNAFLKRGGKVTIKFLPAIPPGLESAAFMQRLEHTLETESALLVEGGLETMGTKRNPYRAANITLGLAAFLIFAYTGAWFALGYTMQKQINRAWVDAAKQGTVLSSPPARVTGFPGPYRIAWNGTVESDQTSIYVRDMALSFWPIPLTPFHLNFPHGLHISSKQIELPEGTGGLNIESLQIAFEIPTYVPVIWTKPEVQKLHDSGITYRLLNISMEQARAGDLALTKLTGSGSLSYDENLQPAGTMDLIFSDPENIRDTLARIVSHPMGKSFVTGAINSLMRVDEKTGEKILPLTFTLKNGKVYAGPLQVGYIGQIYWPVVDPTTSTSPLTR